MLLTVLNPWYIESRTRLAEFSPGSTLRSPPTADLTLLYPSRLALTFALSLGERVRVSGFRSSTIRTFAHIPH